VKLYEGLFILKTSGKEEGIKETTDKVCAEITAAGGKVETVQKMDKRAFARVADKRNSSGFYVNIIFQSSESAITTLRTRFAMAEDVFRVNFFVAPEPGAAAAAAATATAAAK